MCCKHFDSFVSGLLAIGEALTSGRHETLKTEIGVPDKKSTPPKK
jgi:hypothetical protein